MQGAARADRLGHQRRDPGGAPARTAGGALVSVQEINGMEGDIITMSELFRFERTGRRQGRQRPRLDSSRPASSPASTSDSSARASTCRSSSSRRSGSAKESEHVRRSDDSLHGLGLRGRVPAVAGPHRPRVRRERHGRASCCKQRLGQLDAVSDDRATLPRCCGRSTCANSRRVERWLESLPGMESLAGIIEQAGEHDPGYRLVLMSVAARRTRGHAIARPGPARR